MTPQSLGKALKNEMFADRETITEAVEYAYKIAASLGEGHNRIAVITAIHVIMNSIAKVLTEMPVPDTIPEYTSEEEVCRDALMIFNGACNSAGITRSLAGMCKYLWKTGDANTHPAVSLVLTQLNHLNNYTARDVFEDVHYCEDKKGE